jgi:very-short-patch-repair endonuclease
MTQRGRELRKESTEAEQILWKFLRNRKLHGLKFRRQYQAGKFILDFYCAEKKLCIEVDGGIHQEPIQKERDVERSAELGLAGIKVIRFKNEEIRKNIGEVLKRIGAVG